jgi:hypothetical protein
MAVVVVGMAPDQETYDEVSSRLMESEQLPEGCLVHIASPTSGGFRVITVWDSEDQYRQFREEKLVPTIKEISGGTAEGPDAEVQPVHKHITA